MQLLRLRPFFKDDPFLKTELHGEQVEFQRNQSRSQLNLYRQSTTNRIAIVDHSSIVHQHNLKPNQRDPCGLLLLNIKSTSFVALQTSDTSCGTVKFIPKPHLLDPLESKMIQVPSQVR